jgi:hypothetical protein
MPDVFVLWHISHALRPDAANIAHVDENGDPLCDEQAGDNVKLLGIYSSSARAHARIRAARLRPGFAEEPDCFQVIAYCVDDDKWESGFAIADERNAQSQRYERDAEVLARIGAALGSQPTSLTVRLPADLASQALAAWQREETAQPGTETRSQRPVRLRASWLALIGLSVQQTGRRDGSDVVCELDATTASAALDARGDQ